MLWCSWEASSVNFRELLFGVNSVRAQNLLSQLHYVGTSALTLWNRLPSLGLRNWPDLVKVWP